MPFDPEHPEDIGRNTVVRMSYDHRACQWIATVGLGQDEERIAAAATFIGLAQAMIDVQRSAWRDVATARNARNAKIKADNERRAAEREARIWPRLPLDTPIREIPFSVRVHNALINEGCKILRDAIPLMTRWQGISNFGKTSWQEVQAALHAAVRTDSTA